MDYRVYRKVLPDGSGAPRSWIPAAAYRTWDVTVRRLLALLSYSSHEHFDPAWGSDGFMENTGCPLYQWC